MVATATLAVIELLQRAPQMVDAVRAWFVQTPDATAADVLAKVTLWHAEVDATAASVAEANRLMGGE